MKTYSFILMFAAILAFVLVGCSDKSSPVASVTDQAINSPSGSMSLGKMTMTAFTGKESAYDFGVGKYVGKGNRLVGKDVWFTSLWSTSESVLNGWAEYTFNASFNAHGEGPMQGKFTLTAGGGTWSGTVEGKMFMASDGGLQGTFNYVGQGKGGSIDGMKLSCTETYYDSDWHGDLVGFIK
jgi:hypothetical protein